MYDYLKRFGDSVYALGTDFLGVKWSNLGDMKRLEDLKVLFRKLKARGWTEEEIERLKWKNALEALGDDLWRSL